MTLFEEFQARNMLAQMTNPEQTQKLIDNEKVSFYVGFDPTADSLHVGHFIQMKIMAHMQRAGHRPIVLFGGGTGMVGDPSGKSDMRKMLTREEIQHNVDSFKKQMSKFIDISDGKAVFVDNADWLAKLNYIDFLREVGVHFSVNRMLTAECYKTRMEKGLTFLEFNYMLMQGYDFYHLYKNYGCLMEFGGDDQWSNILGGVDLIRRKEQKEVYGVTFKLLTTSEGKKMGKTEKGALWLDPEKTPPYEFFQYWRNIADADVINCMKWLTFVPVEEIEAIKMDTGAEINAAKEKLAYEITALVHSKEEADKALAAARALFSQGVSNENMPTTNLSGEDLTDGKITLLDLLVKTKLAPSKSEARRLVMQGGVFVDDVKIEDIGTSYDAEALKNGLIIKKGKKAFHKAILG